VKYPGFDTTLGFALGTAILAWTTVAPGGVRDRARCCCCLPTTLGGGGSLGHFGGEGSAGKGGGGKGGGPAAIAKLKMPPVWPVLKVSRITSTA